MTYDELLKAVQKEFDGEERIPDLITGLCPECGQELFITEETVIVCEHFKEAIRKLHETGH